jgi:hypothetical protein
MRLAVRSSRSRSPLPFSLMLLCTARRRWVVRYDNFSTLKKHEIALLLLLACFAASQAKPRCAIIINLAAQRLYLYQDSRVVFITKLSTRRTGLPTPRGSYQITEKDVCHTSTIYHVSMPYFMRLDGEPFGIHYGYNPGHPASHGCIRVGSMAEAKTLFRMTPSGTIRYH